MTRDAKFWSYLAKGEPDACWKWEGPSDSNGYGTFKSNKQLYRAHRLSYEMFVGPIPKGYDVCHRCDNPPCCNPAHLFAGTRKDNMQDAKRKGRLVFETRRKALLGRFGADHPGHKLTPDQAKEIRNLRQTTSMSQKAIAALFKVNQSTISDLLRGESWRHHTAK